MVPNDASNPDSLAALQRAATQLLNDIGAMGAGVDEEFGEFSDWTTGADGGVVISWPNLAISASRLREALNVSRG